MRAGLALAFAVFLMLAAEAAYALDINDSSGDPDGIGEPDWDIGSIVKDYSNTTTNATNTNTTNQTCVSKWFNAGCSIWSECDDGIQSRNCELHNPCMGIKDVTTETRSCTNESVMQPTTTTSSANATNASVNNTAQQATHPTNATGNETDKISTNHNLTNTTNQSTNLTGMASNLTNVTTARDGSPTKPAIEINMTVPFYENESISPPQTEKQPRTSEAAAPNITRVYDVIEANTTAIVPIEKPEVAMRQIAVDVINRTTDVQITVMQLPEKPVEIQVDVAVRPEQRVYGYIEVNHTNLANENIKNSSITFEVKKAWLRQNRINASTVRLSRYDNRWNELATILINETEDSVYYEAESPGLSIFAIVGEQMLQYTGRICVPLDRRCAGNTLQECSMDGNAWKEVEDCAFACRIDRCLNATEAKEGSQEERNLFSYVVIIIILLALIIVLGMIASHFRNKAKVLRMERDGYPN